MKAPFVHIVVMSLLITGCSRLFGGPATDERAPVVLVASSHATASPQHSPTGSGRTSPGVARGTDSRPAKAVRPVALPADPELITFGAGAPFGVRMLWGEDSTVPLVGLVSPNGEEAVLSAEARSIGIDDDQFVFRALASACRTPSAMPPAAPAYSLPDAHVSWTITSTARSDSGAGSDVVAATAPLLPASLGPGAYLVQVGGGSPFAAAAELPVLVADRRLTSARDARGLTVAVSGPDGGPRFDVVIDALDCGGGILNRGQPGPDGKVTLAASGIHLSRMIVARRDGRIVGAAYLPLARAPGSPGAKYRVVLERALPTYRPGETLHFHAYVLENKPEGPVPAPHVPVWFGFSEVRPEVAALTDAFGVASASVTLPPATGAPEPLVVTVDGEPHRLDIGGRVPGTVDALTVVSHEPLVSLSRQTYAVAEDLTAAIRGHAGMAVTLVSLCLEPELGTTRQSSASGANEAGAVAWRRCGHDLPFTLLGPVTPVHLEVGPIRAFEREAAARTGVVRRMLAVLDEREDSRRILAPGAVYEVRDASDSEPRYGPALRVTARTTGVLTASMPITIAVTDAEGKPVEAGVYILTADARVRRAFPGADRLTGALAGLARLPASGPPAGGLQTFPWLGDDASTAFVDLDQGADRATDATKTVIGADGAVAVLLTIPSVGHAWWIRVTAVASDGRTGGTDLVVR